MDNRLFELCEKVYLKTGRINTVQFFDASELYSIKSNYEFWGDAFGAHEFYTEEGDVPFYTSDYLLDKLPPSIESHEYPGERATLWTRKEDDHLDKYPEGRITYFAWYFVTGKVDGVSDFGESADTPLKALLELTLSLHEAGELVSEGQA